MQGGKLAVHPRLSVNEHNDPAQPLTAGGHNWVFDQGSTLCKETDTGPSGAVATGWAIPPNSSTNCVLLPIISSGRAPTLILVANSGAAGAQY